MAGRMHISAKLTEFWRQCTDGQLAIWFRDPAQWSYVVRAPNGEVVADGKSDTLDECEKWAIRHAEEYVEENGMIVISEGVKIPSFATYEELEASDFKLDHRWDWSLLGDWRFVLWPPKDGRQPRERNLRASEMSCGSRAGNGFRIDHAQCRRTKP
jgi:hypothetical protein